MSQRQPEYIIVAEDSPPNRIILVHLLKKLGFETIACDDGQAAWEALEANTDKNIICVISDIMMPLMDGLELLRKIRNHEKWAELPVLLVTAVSDKDYIFEARNLKVDGYILKPITLARVQGKLQELFPDKSLPKLAG